MNYRIILTVGISLILLKCSKPPEVIPEVEIDLSYDQLKSNYGQCNGKGVMTAKGILPWKLNYSFTTQNDSSFILFRDVFGRRVLYVQALPENIMLWDMQRNIQYNAEDQSSIPIFEEMDSYDIAQVLWGEIPIKYSKIINNTISKNEANLVNFKTTSTQVGMVLDKVFFNLDSYDTVVEFTISERDYCDSNEKLLNGIPPNIPVN